MEPDGQYKPHSWPRRPPGAERAVRVPGILPASAISRRPRPAGDPTGKSTSISTWSGARQALGLLLVAAGRRLLKIE